MKIVHIFDIFKEPHWNTFDIDFGEALDKSDQNHQSLIISTLKLSQNQYVCVLFIPFQYPIQDSWPDVPPSPPPP